MNTTRPIPGTRRLVTELDSRIVVAFAPITGQELQPGDDLARRFAPLGEITTRKRWDVAAILGPRPHWGHWRQAQGLDVPGEALLARATLALTARLEDYGTGPKDFGLIHADLRLENLLVDGVRLTAWLAPRADGDTAQTLGGPT